jgi:MATE family multidrug resistance protein
MADTRMGQLGHRRVLAIALPIVLSNATVPILGVVDTAVVGRMGQAAPIGAVGVGAIILTALYWVFGFLRMGTTGLTSQAFGRGDTPEVGAMFLRALLIGLAAGFGLIVLQVPLIHGAFMVSPASPEVEALARTYTGIRIWSAPAAIAIYGITGWLIAVERTRAVLVLQVWMNGVNILLDLLFVPGMGFGVAGVAWATFIAEWSALGLGLYLCRTAFRVRWDWVRILDRARLIHMARVNTDILIRSLLLQAMFVSFLFLGAGFGDRPLAANQVLLQFLHITAYGLDGFAFAVETLVGQALGARRRSALRRAVVLCAIWSGITAVGTAVAFGVFGGAIIDAMTTAPDIRTEARHYLPYMVLAPLIGVVPWLLDGVFIGATRTGDMRNMMALSFAIYVGALALLLPAFGNHGLWVALLVSFAARGATLGVRYTALERAADAPAPQSTGS